MIFEMIIILLLALLIGRNEKRIGELEDIVRKLRKGGKVK